ncbi:Glycosyltransferase family 10 (fucosyltransferase) [compost metagenome]
MPKVNIITPFVSNEFSRQVSTKWDQDFIFFENGPQEEKYDLIVVYEGLNSRTRINCNKENIVFISGEPPMSRRYTKSFLSQFATVISSHPNIKHHNNILYQQSLPWHFGLDFKTRAYNYSFDELQSLQLPQKTKKLSIIASSKTMMPGHNKRVKFVNELKKAFGDSIDFYGKDTNPVNDKADAILPYQMSICIENSAINNYWTEKIADVLLGYSLPIYHGCLNIDNYFHDKSFISLDVKNINKGIKQIEYLLDNCDTIYKERLPFIIEARNLLLNKYNIYPSIIDLYNKNSLNKNTSSISIELQPNHAFNDYKLTMNLLRLERFSKKLLT